jgi:hypothetical protein
LFAKRKKKPQEIKESEKMRAPVIVIWFVFWFLFNCVLLVKDGDRPCAEAGKLRVVSQIQANVSFFVSVVEVSF